MKTARAEKRNRPTTRYLPSKKASLTIRNSLMKIEKGATPMSTRIETKKALPHSGTRCGLPP